jgi:queuosine precursor transporter
MNEAIALISFVCLASIVVGAAYIGRTALFSLSVTFILLSNITVQMPVRLFGVDISWAIVIYSLVYFITDIICEYHGKRIAYYLALSNLLAQLLLWCYVWSSMQVVPSNSGQAVYNTMVQLFATTTQVSAAAIVASLGPFVDIYIFGRIRQIWDKCSRDGRLGYHDHTRSRLLAVIIRNKVGTFAGQIVNTVIFFTLASGANMPTEQLAMVIATACVTKITVAIADIPFLAMVERILARRIASTSRDAGG